MRVERRGILGHIHGFQLFMNTLDLQFPSDISEESGVRDNGTSLRSNRVKGKARFQACDVTRSCLSVVKGHKGA
jgi:hypothetical protein